MTEEKSRQVRVSNSQSVKELAKAEAQLDKFDDEVKSLTLDRLNQAPKLETEQQTKLSSNEIAKSKAIYLKPKRSIGCRDKFNEAFREDYEFQKEYVQFIAENKEQPGSMIETWTRPFGGMAAEEWDLPVNIPVWGPRYLAEQIKRKCYHRLVMQDNVMTNSTGMGQMYGAIVADSTIQRLDAVPVSNNRSVFMGSKGF